MVSEDIKKPKIYDAIAKAISKIQPVTRSGYNTEQRYYYKRVDDVVIEVHNAIKDLGLLCIQKIESQTTSEYISSKSQTKGFRTIVSVKYTWYCAEDASTIETFSVGEAIDYADKSIAKALSFALKSMLVSLFLVGGADEDDEEEKEKETKTKSTLTHSVNKEEAITNSNANTKSTNKDTDEKPTSFPTTISPDLQEYFDNWYNKLNAEGEFVQIPDAKLLEKSPKGAAVKILINAFEKYSSNGVWFPISQLDVPKYNEYQQVWLKKWIVGTKKAELFGIAPPPTPAK
jgi:hypothetical protein